MIARPRRLGLGALLLGVLLAVLCAAAVPAQAAGYRYWSFWDLDGDTWTYAQQGPSTTRPADGDVQGFRFAVSEDSQDAAKPRAGESAGAAATFASACEETPAREGRKRVALIIDFGTAGDAPKGETPQQARAVCAQVAPDATTAEALAEVAKPLRYDSNALLCAIAGYPKTGCGDQVSGSGGDKQESPAADGQAAPSSGSASDSSSDSSDDGPSAGLLAGLAAVLALGAAAVWQARRRRG
ncbi:SCO2322 family protein [Streptomyces sp. E11-3]|uniref:SCO2322 family protein n=1 Tax=Streptomyces sp. E11-3 TaxID=3110112 RepID=UPI0039812ED9